MSHKHFTNSKILSKSRVYDEWKILSIRAGSMFAIILSLFIYWTKSKESDLFTP